ncbi:hypothetical protein HZB02_00835 [Candidatus Woesearchaeota archaeon]|nr:hypothetical protein [Candidatus Woesearchaeota archaeon]
MNLESITNSICLTREGWNGKNLHPWTGFIYNLKSQAIILQKAIAMRFLEAHFAYLQSITDEVPQAFDPEKYGAMLRQYNIKQVWEIPYEHGYPGYLHQIVERLQPEADVATMDTLAALHQHQVQRPNQQEYDLIISVGVFSETRIRELGYGPQNIIPATNTLSRNPAACAIHMSLVNISMKNDPPVFERYGFSSYASPKELWYNVPTSVEDTHGLTDLLMLARQQPSS